MRLKSKLLLLLISVPDLVKSGEQANFCCKAAKITYLLLLAVWLITHVLRYPVASIQREDVMVRLPILLPVLMFIKLTGLSGHRCFPE